MTLIVTAITLTLLTITAYARYSNTANLSVTLTYSSTYGAECGGTVNGYSGATISDGSLVLKDSSGSVIKSWTGLSSSTNTLNVGKVYDGVSKGSTYTLTLYATVNRNGTSEDVSVSTTQKYN